MLCTVHLIDALTTHPSTKILQLQKYFYHDNHSPICVTVLNNKPTRKEMCLSTENGQFLCSVSLAVTMVNLLEACSLTVLYWLVNVIVNSFESASNGCPPDYVNWTSSGNDDTSPLISICGDLPPPSLLKKKACVYHDMRENIFFSVFTIINFKPFLNS